MLSCGAEIRQFGLESDSVEEAGERIVRYLYDHLLSADGQRASVMVRLFKSLRFDQLDDELKRYASKNFNGFADSRHLALIASAGDLPGWNDRRQSKSHRLIPLSNPDLLLEKMPMMAEFIQSLGYNSHWIGSAEDEVKPSVRDLDKNPNVFYVPEALDSPVIYDQEMVRRFGIRSVLGYGGPLNSASFFCVVVFSKVFVPRKRLQLFQPLSLSTKTALIHANDFRPLVSRRELA